jgi:hypothetical protein
MIYTVAGRIVKDRVNRHVTARCFVCTRPFTDGRPSGEAGYYDGDRNYIHVYCCHPNEYPQLLQKVKEKEDAIRAQEELIEKAARNALVDARRAAQ